MTGIKNPETRQLQVLNGHAHGAGRPRGIAVCAFEPIAFAGDGDQEIEFCSSMGCPETCASRVQTGEELLNRKTFK